jgi:hypothetical protein
MKINRDNYEAYFLDYFEGQLSPEMVQEVLLFVELNPDLKNIFTDFEAVTLTGEDDIVFEDKAGLKKNQVFATSQINDSNYEEFLIGETEGLLDTNQLSALDEFICINPQFENDRRLFTLAHLTKDDEVVFEAKESLKQKAIPVGAISADTYETYFARELEGDLNTDEKLQLAGFMKYNPQLEKERRLYKHTILAPDTEIVFENKNQLKQSVTPVRRIIYYALSAAASLALIMSVYFLLDRNNIPQNIAQQGNKINSTEQPISPPETKVPDKQVALTDSKPETGISTSDQSSDYAETNLQAGNKVVLPGTDSERNTEIAVNYRQSVEPLQAKSVHKVSTRQYVDPQFTFIRTSQMYMNENLEFYYNLKLAEQIEYAQLNTKDKNPAKTIMNAATGKAEDIFAMNRKTPDREEKKNVSLWTFAELGVQTYNTFTSSDVELKLRKDEEGKVVAYGLEGGILDFEKEVKK